MQSVSSNAVANELEWKVLNGNNINNISSGKEVAISVWFRNSANLEILYSKTFAIGMLDLTITQNVFLDGYYLSSSDYGLCNITNTSGVLTIRNVYYGGVNYTNTANMKIRYR